MASKPFSRMIYSSVGKKLVMALSGLFLVSFIIIHMLGNLSYLPIMGGSDAFNLYSYRLNSLGPLLWLIELVLVAGFIAHAFFAIRISLENRKARPVRYAKVTGAGEPSRKTISSTSMIVTGVILLVFLVIHIFTFKYGTYYSTTVGGVAMRDLHRLVAEKFHNPAYAFGYLGVMLLLGFHLRHGFWSAFQSLGANHPRYSGMIYTTGVVLAILLTLGFVVVPVFVYFS